MNSPPSYTAVTEHPGLKATPEQLERLYQRYRFAVPFAAGRVTMEIGCGSGLGLAYLSPRCPRVIGIDIDPENVAAARRTCAGLDNVAVHRMDAQALDLPDGACEVILLYEAIYYLDRPAAFVAEAHRLLAPSGLLLICTVNKDWRDFHPSPHSRTYLAVPELNALLRERFRSVDFYGGFPVHEGGLKARFVSRLKRAAVRWDLIPGSLASRAVLKRLFIGKTYPIPDRITDGMARYEAPRPIPADRATADWKILYAVARKEAAC